MDNLALLINQLKTFETEGYARFISYDGSNQLKHTLTTNKIDFSTHDTEDYIYVINPSVKVDLSQLK